MLDDDDMLTYGQYKELQKERDKWERRRLNMVFALGLIGGIICGAIIF